MTPDEELAGYRLTWNDEDDLETGRAAAVGYTLPHPGFCLSVDGEHLGTPADLSAAAQAIAARVGYPVWLVPDPATREGAKPFTYVPQRGLVAA